MEISKKGNYIFLESDLKMLTTGSQFGNIQKRKLYTFRFRFDTAHYYFQIWKYPKKEIIYFEDQILKNGITASKYGNIQKRK
jgi:hypothetical protein